jgi:hypothetical protein
LENALTLQAEPTHTPEALDAPAKPVQDNLSRLVQYYLSAEEVTQTAREKAERDRDYLDGKQLTTTEYDALVKRGQPPISFNVIRSRVAFLQGLEKKQRRDPKAFPRNNPQDAQAADAFTDGMRYVIEEADYQTSRSRAWDNICVEGFGGVEIAAVQRRDGSFDFDIIHIPWDRLGYDPHSVAPDFSDAKYLFQVLWLDEEDALARYADNPNAASVLENSLSAVSHVSETYDDKPKWTVWADGKRNRVRIVMMWHKEASGWKYCEFTKAGKLLESDGAYVDEEGDTYCPWVVESNHIDRDNNRYGEVRDLIDPQDEINKRRSKALDLLTRRGVIADEGAVESVSETRKELAKTNFYITKTPGAEFQIITGSELAAGQAQLGQQAMQYIAQAGPNAALLGKGVEDQSGRAIEAQQQGGLIEHGNLLDSLRRLDRRVFRIVALLIKQFWTAEKWFRVTDDLENARFVGLNIQKPVMETRQDPYTGQTMEVPVIDPWSGQPKVDVENEVAKLDLDIIITDAPDVISLQGENYQAFIELMKSGLPPPLLKIAIEMNPSLTGKVKKQLTEMVEQLSQPQGQQGPQGPPQMSPLEQAMIQLQIEEKRAGIDNQRADTMNKQATAAKNGADAEAKRASIAPPVLVPVPVPALSQASLQAPAY